MAKPSGGAFAIGPEARAFAAALERWLDRHGSLCTALRDRRDRGEDVASLLAVPAVSAARISWDLWEELRRSVGADPEGELRSVLSDEELRALRYAFWGAQRLHRTGDPVPAVRSLRR